MTAGLSLIVLLVTAFACRRASVLGGTMLVLTSLLWLWANQAMEGRVLLSVTPTHGVTEGDLAGLVGIVLGLYATRYGIAALLRRLAGRDRR